MSQDRLKHSISIAKHIPSGEQYVPADSVIVTDSWDDDSTDYVTRFKALDGKANAMIEQWTNPAKGKAVKGEEPAASTPAPSAPTSAPAPNQSEELIHQADTSALQKAAETAASNVPWKGFQGATDADKFARGKTEPGWASAYHEAAPIVEWMKATSSPWVIAGWMYTISKDGAFLQRKRVTA